MTEDLGYYEEVYAIRGDCAFGVQGGLRFEGTAGSGHN